MEESAINVLKRAVVLDQERRFDQAIVCYEEGIGLLLKALKGFSSNVKKEKYRAKINEYMGRAEKLKQAMKKLKDAEKFNKVIQIEENTIGHNYSTIFSDLLDITLTEVEIDDPYIRSNHQIINFIRFCELLHKSDANVKKIILNTSCENDENKKCQQKQAFSAMCDNFKGNNIELEVSYSKTLHDREIRFNNGWIVKIGRGLDYFKNVPKFSLGFYDYDLRPCHETTINIFHAKHVKEADG
ncbi:Hypothetical predicted protein [Octopus vulgaris]|uniref:MIT domain-containing protein n=1 Tax=Octopus vulgaris TaxID=6645 RepID=A0AA36ASY1_OCTVU|nr:Hypothetical predicted protein [Octopus vulgaris]